jgi:hypothetical protein
MSSYNKIERSLAQLLETFPRVRQLTKFLYQRLMYVLNYSLTDVILSEKYTLDDPFLDLDGETFFGYYDKSSINSRGDMLTHRVLEGCCSIFVKLCKGTLIAVAEVEAWNWQQGAMATWLSDDLVAYNDISDGLAVCCVFSVSCQKVVSTHKNAIQCYSPATQIYASIDYKKLNLLRPEYGYPKLGIEDCDHGRGISLFQFSSGESVGKLRLEEINNFLTLSDSFEMSKINHCQFSPDGSLVLFMYRAYRSDGKHSYLLAWDYKDGKLLKLMDNRVVSHYSWFDDTKILVWGRGGDETGYHFVDLDGNLTAIKFIDPLLIGDGHPSINTKNLNILTDTYPNKARLSTLFLIDGAREEKIVQLKQPWRFNGPGRVDLHPRFSEDGDLITLESGHTGRRRQYVLKKKD